MKMLLLFGLFFIVTSNSYAQLQLFGTPTGVSCYGANDGTITLFASGGTSPYIYQCGLDQNSTGYFTGISCGTYPCSVTDALGATAGATVIVVCPTQLQATATTYDISCFGLSDGSVTITANGGTPPYTYQLGGNLTALNLFTNLGAGSYNVEVTDANGCFTTVPFVINEPSQLQATATAVNVSCFGLSDGSVTITASGGTPGYVYGIQTVTQSSPFFSGFSGSFTGTTYTFQVTDANGCVASVNQNIYEPALLNISLTKTDVSCFGSQDGSITAAVSGGTPGYGYSINGGSLGPNNSFTSLIGAATGLVYSVTVVDQNGCSANSSETIFSPSTALSAQVTLVDATSATTCDGSANITASGGTAPYTYTWASAGVATNEVTNLCPGLYDYCVTDANGCLTCNNAAINDASQNNTDSVLIYSNTSYPDSIIIGSLTTVTMEDCVIDYAVVDSAGITGYIYNASLDSVLITWEVYDANGVVLSTYANVPYPIQTNALGVYDATLIVFCPQRAVGYNTIEINDQVYLHPNYMGIQESVNAGFTCSNPFDNSLELTIEKESDVVIQLFDLNGKLLNKLEEKGKVAIRMDTRNLSNGTYFLQVNLDGSIFHRKVLK